MFEIIELENLAKLHIFYRQLDFSSEPGVANEILEKERKGSLVLSLIFTRFSKKQLWWKKNLRLGSC